MNRALERLSAHLRGGGGAGGGTGVEGEGEGPRVTPERQRQALVATLESNPGMDNDLESWIEEAQMWLALNEEQEAEIGDLRQAMAVSLKEAEELKEKMKGEAPGGSSRETLDKFLGKSKILQAMIPTLVCPTLLSASPCLGSIEKLLELEAKCMRWYSGSKGASSFFVLLGQEVSGLVEGIVIEGGKPTRVKGLDEDEGMKRPLLQCSSSPECEMCGGPASSSSRARDPSLAEQCNKRVWKEMEDWALSKTERVNSGLAEINSSGSLTFIPSIFTNAFTELRSKEGGGPAAGGSNECKDGRGNKVYVPRVHEEEILVLDSDSE